MAFRDRTDAGERLATALKHLAVEDPVVLALPRGGVPVGVEVARALGAPLGLLIVRKLGVPLQPELAMGAVADSNPPLVVRNDQIIRALRISERDFQDVLKGETEEVRRRRTRYLGERKMVPLAGRTIVVVDDGVATGATMQAALRALRISKPRRIVLAVPVAAIEALDVLGADADEIVCLQPQAALGAIGAYYIDFGQVSDEEVAQALADAART